MSSNFQLQRTIIFLKVNFRAVQEHFINQILTTVTRWHFCNQIHQWRMVINQLLDLFMSRTVLLDLRLLFLPKQLYCGDDFEFRWFPIQKVF